LKSESSGGGSEKRTAAELEFMLLLTFNQHFFYTETTTPGAAFSKVPRKILGRLLILGTTDTQVATSSRGYTATVEHCTVDLSIVFSEVIGNCVVVVVIVVVR